jgi:hypothetical protein
MAGGTAAAARFGPGKERPVIVGHYRQELPHLIAVRMIGSMLVHGPRQRLGVLADHAPVIVAAQQVPERIPERLHVRELVGDGQRVGASGNQIREQRLDEVFRSQPRPRHRSWVERLDILDKLNELVDLLIDRFHDLALRRLLPRVKR